jgi:hypothetical protein
MVRKALGGISARGRYAVQAVPKDARGVSIPAPVGGWNAISPLAAMPETDAVSMDNLFPQPGYVEIRKGHALHNTLAPVLAPVESIMGYAALDSADDKLFAASGTGVFDVTITASATLSPVVTSLTNARLQHINFSTSGGNFLWFCNGADAPRKWDGSAWSTASVSGVTPTDVVGVAAYSERIWMVLKDAISPAFLATDAIQGTATPFDLAGVFNKGGFLQAIGTWSRDGGQGPDDYIAFMTSRGEVAIYTGDPQRNMELAGVYEMGAPIGRRCMTKVGPDLAVVCIDGVVPLSRAIQTDRAAILQNAITAKIQPVMNQSARDWGANFGWQMISYPRGTRAILNVPSIENAEQVQYVMNTVTGSWCRFLEESANCWEVFQERLFYGDNSGRVIEADCQGFDYDGPIEFNLESSFNYCGTRGQLKDFTMCRSLLLTDGQTVAGLALNIDFGRNAVVNSLSFPTDPLALWDVALWDAGLWPETSRVVTDWVATEGQGYVCSVRMQGSIQLTDGADETQPVVYQVNGWDILVIDGAFI